MKFYEGRNQRSVEFAVMCIQLRLKYVVIS